MSVESFDDERRAWIAAHAGVWMVQKRRAELLGKQIRARARGKVGARPDPHDDQVTPPLVFRSSSTSTGAVETVVVMALAIVAPLGWALGRAVCSAIVPLIPERLQSYPIVAMAWTAVISGLPLPLFYDPAPTLTSIVLVPWMVAQIPAAFAMASCYGVLEGWLAIDGASDWWPLAPVQRTVDAGLLLGPAPVLMPTLLDPMTPGCEDAPRIPRRRPAPVNWWKLWAPAALCGVGVLWTIAYVANAVLHFPATMVHATH